MITLSSKIANAGHTVATSIHTAAVAGRMKLSEVAASCSKLFNNALPTIRAAAASAGKTIQNGFARVRKAVDGLSRNQKVAAVAGVAIGVVGLAIAASRMMREPDMRIQPFPFPIVQLPDLL